MESKSIGQSRFFTYARVLHMRLFKDGSVYAMIDTNVGESHCRVDSKEEMDKHLREHFGITETTDEFFVNNRLQG